MFNHAAIILDKVVSGNFFTLACESLHIGR